MRGRLARVACAVLAIPTRATRLSLSAVVVLLVGLPAGCGGDTSLGRDAQLFVVDLASGDRSQLTDNAMHVTGPSWCPDSRIIAVAASGTEAGEIALLEANDGERHVVVRARGSFQGVACSPRGNRLAYVRLEDETRWSLATIGLDGSTPETLDVRRSGRAAFTGPAWSPDGMQVAYAAGFEVVVVPATGGAPARVVAEASAPEWSSDGRSVLVFTGRSLLAVPLGRGRTVTTASALLDAHASWRPSSDEVAFSGVRLASDRRYHLYLARVGSQRLSSLADEVVSTAPAWSPDGRLVAYATWVGAIEIRSVATGETRTLTRLPGAEVRDLAWSPDGERLAFVARRVPED